MSSVAKQCTNTGHRSDLLHYTTAMITHQTLYNLANYLGALAMITVVAYHFVAVNARYISANGQGGKN